jgi:hypothetical protein
LLDIQAVLFIDSGGYETSPQYESGEVYRLPHKPRRWTIDNLRKVLDHLPTRLTLVAVSYDHHGPLNTQISRAKKFFSRYPHMLSDFLIKPPTRSAALDMNEVVKAAPLLITGRWPGTSVPFVGRHAERVQLDRLVSAAANGRTTPVVLVTGEPGIGKSHLLNHLVGRMTAIGGFCLKGRAFEAEAARPYGAWIDALRTIPAETVPEDVRRSLALLRPEWGPPLAGLTDRARLFGAVLLLLGHLSRQVPLLVILDDLQWLDEASSALFHYAARKPNPSAPTLFACAARSGELMDNPAVSRMLRALGQDQRVLEISLAALSASETAELVLAIDPAVDAAAVFAESDGNPLFAWNSPGYTAKDAIAPAARSRR